eukprot:Lankesteria_metandrocarpae@DN5040_c0_g1_i1.p1
MHQSFSLHQIQEEQKFDGASSANCASGKNTARTTIVGQPSSSGAASVNISLSASETGFAVKRSNPACAIEGASPLKKSRMTSEFESTLGATVTPASNGSLYDAQTAEQYDSTAADRAAPSGPADGASSGKVLLLRRLAPAVNEKDVEAMVLPFCRGVTPKVFLQSLSGFAFVEFVDEETAAGALQYLQQYPVVLKGSTVEVMRSKRDAVVNNTEAAVAGGSFRVLLASITNIAYPIDLELLNFLFSKYGFVEKIVTFMKNPATFQALIQFADSEQAGYALSMLSNRNIYDSCNSLQLQPSKLKELSVRVNNAKTWDFTVGTANYSANAAGPSAGYIAGPGGLNCPAVGVAQSPTGAAGAAAVAAGGGVPLAPDAAAKAGAHPPGSLLPTPMNPMAPQAQRALFMPNDAMMAGRAHGQGMPQHAGGYPSSPHGMHPMYAQGMMGAGMGAAPPHHSIPGMPMDPSGGRAPHPYGIGARPSSPLDNAAIQAKMPRELREVNFDSINPTNTPLVIVYHLSSEIVDVMQLFNLFSLYGPVLRIKILRDKRDTALVQYTEPHFATLAFTYLQGVPVYSEESGIQICFSKNSEVIMPMQRPGESGADCKTRSFFAKEQRYPSNEPEKYFRSACKPRCTLFVAGLPEDATESEVRAVFQSYGETTSFKFRESAEMAKKKAAHIEMANESQAVKALCNLHDQTIRDGHNIKVAFSRAVIRQ